MPQTGAKHDGYHGIYEEGVQFFPRFPLVLENTFHDVPSHDKGDDPQQVIILDLDESDFEENIIGIPVKS